MEKIFNETEWRQAQSATINSRALRIAINRNKQGIDGERERESNEVEISSSGSTVAEKRLPEENSAVVGSGSSGGSTSATSLALSRFEN